MSDFSNPPGDPVRVTEEASTFAESAVTVSNNATKVAGGSLQLAAGTGNWVDDFEDGVDAGWSGDTSNLLTTTSTVLSGSQTGEVTSNNELTALTSPSLPDQTQDSAFKINLSNKSTNQFDRVDLKIKDDTNTQLATLSFDDDVSEIQLDGNTVRSWTVNVTYKIVMSFDFSNSEVDITINGVNEGTFAIATSPTYWNFFELENITSNSGISRSVFIDNIPPAASGDAVISFDTGSPADINSWDLVTFQSTLNGETVTIDVEDSNGNVLKTDISKDAGISDIPTSTDVRLRANLSRSNTANDPTLDYAARRFTR